MLGPSYLVFQVLGMSSQYLHCEVKVLEDGYVFHTTFIYDSNNHQEREELWRDLLNLLNPAPWVVLGDFNVIRFPTEKYGAFHYALPMWMNSTNACTIVALRT